MSLPSRFDPPWRDLVTDCAKILRSQASVTFPGTSRSTPSDVVVVRSVYPMLVTNLYPGDIWEYVVVPVLDKYVNKLPFPSATTLELELKGKYRQVDLAKEWDR